MHAIKFAEELDSDTLWELSDISNNEPGFNVVSQACVQCHAEERDIAIEALDDMGTEYPEGETADETE